MQDPRLEQVYQAASRLFIHQGYPKTQVSHIVKETGISTGAMYDLFAGKQEMYAFVIACTISPQLLRSNLTLPLQKEQFGDLEQRVLHVFENVLAVLRAPLEENADSCTFEMMLSDAFDLLSRYRTGCLLFEANPQVYPELFTHYKAYRLEFYQLIKRYVAHFIAKGAMRSIGDEGLCAKFIIETLYWWSMHVHYDGFNPSEEIPEHIAKEICLDALLHAYAV